MSRVFQALFVFVFALTFCFQNAVACTVDIEPLRKTYRQSKNVFLGEIISIESVDKEELPEKLKEFKYLEKLTFKVNKSWKGNNKQVVVYSSPICNCPMREYDFSIGRKFLVFDDKSSNFDICNLSNIELITDKNKDSQKIIKRLDNFSFRLWAKIYPF